MPNKYELVINSYFNARVIWETHLRTTSYAISHATNNIIKFRYYQEVVILHGSYITRRSCGINRKINGINRLINGIVRLMNGITQPYSADSWP